MTHGIIPSTHSLFIYQARPIDTLDGDTLRLVIDQGLKGRQQEDIRLLDVWCPDPSKREPGAHEAASFVDSWLFPLRFTQWDEQEWPLMVRTLPNRNEQEIRSFTRYIGVVWRKSDGHCLNDAIITAGHGATTREGKMQMIRIREREQ